MRHAYVAIIAACIGVGLVLRPEQSSAQIPTIPPSTGGTVAIARQMASVRAGLVPLIDLQKLIDPSIVNTSLRAAREHPDSLVAAWKFQRDYTSIANGLLKGTCDTAFCTYLRAVAFANMSNDKTKRAEFEKSIHAQDKAVEPVLSDLDALGELLTSTLEKELAPPTVVLFANGDIQGIATGGAAQSATATGSLGIKVSTERTLWRATISVASTVDTLRSGFGVSVLTPGLGKARGAGTLSLVFQLPTGLHVQALHLYASAAAQTWRDTLPILATKPDTVVDATTMGFGALGYWDLACCKVGDNDVSLSVEVGPTVRWIAGDVASTTAIRQDLLGTTGTVYPGAEAGFELDLSRVSAQVQLYRLWDVKKGTSVRGLTGFQLVAAFSVDGEIFHGNLGP